MRHLKFLALLLLVACAPLELLRQEPTHGALYPQVSRVEGHVSLKPRYSRELQPLTGPTVLEPGDWIQTGADSKVEVLLPQAVLRVYGHTNAQVLYSFQNRTAVAQDVDVKEGEVLVRTLTPTPFTVRTEGLEVEARTPSVLLVGARLQAHHTACYQGAAEARNIRVRGQTIVKLVPGHHLTLDEGPTTAYLQQEKLADEWRRWERDGVAASGLVPLPPELPPAAQSVPVANKP